MDLEHRVVAALAGWFALVLVVAVETSWDAAKGRMVSARTGMEIFQLVLSLLLIGVLALLGLRLLS